MKIKYLFSLVLLIFCFSTFAFSQGNTISPEKRKLIAEIITVLKADQNVKEVMQATFKQMDDQYPLLVKAIVERQTDLTAQQKTELADALTAMNKKENSIQNRLMAAINFQDYVEKAFYPLYDKFFTEDELKDLLAFYKSSTGKKMIEIMPQLAAESMRLAQEILLPKIIETVERVINEDVQKQKKEPKIKSY